jgi:hypothetical protein
MDIVTSALCDDSRLNIITPTAQCLSESVQYPSLDDWINVFLECLMNETSWQAHWKLHLFLIHWNKSLDEGWLRVLLSKRHCKSSLVDGSFYRTHFNEGETILILLVSLMLQAHGNVLKKQVRQRVQNLSKAFKKTKIGLSAILKKPPLLDEINPGNFMQLLKQSLRWRHTFPNDQSTKDPIFSFVNKRNINCLMIPTIKKIETDIAEDRQISNWMTKECVAPLLRYLIVTKHNSLTSNDILNKFEIRISNESQYPNIIVHNIPDESTVVCKWRVDETSVRSVASLEEEIILLQPFSEFEDGVFFNESLTEPHANKMEDHSMSGDEVSANTTASLNKEQSLADRKNVRVTAGAKRWGDTTKRCFGNKEMHKEVLTMLTLAVQKKDGWKNAVVLADNPEFFDMITVDQAVKIIKQLTLLKHAVSLALEQPEKSWENILEETTSHHCYERMSPRTLERTFHQFKKHKFKLPHPNSLEVDSMKKKQRERTDNFLETYPDLKQLFLAFSRDNLRRFSVDMMHHFVNEKLMPKLQNEIRCAIREKEGIHIEAEEDLKINEIIKRQYGFRNGTISRTTVYTWIRKLDFKYSSRKKQYFNDRHEDQKEQREEFIKKRLEDEIYQPVWVQKSAIEFKNLQNDGTLSASLQGFTYHDDDGMEMIEVHIDSDKGNMFLKELEDSLYGGFFSIRKPPNSTPLIVLGHDEAIMKQNQFTPCAWTMGDGTGCLIPKMEGAGIMYSLFVSRATGVGFGSFWTEEIQQIVNQNRQGKKYFDEEAAIEVLGKSEKDPLLSDPANRKFNYGGANGWWTGNHVIVQVEDCIDAFFTIFPSFHPVFLFDNSTGHSKGRRNGLNVNNMNKNFGGKQDKLHSSVVSARCLGPFSPKLEPGDEQTFCFEEEDEGPFYLSATERGQRKYDMPMGKQKTRNLTIAELKEKLSAKGVNFFGRKLRKDLVDLAAIHGISEKETSETILEGWMGKSKGMFQIAWERGYIDPAQVAQYQVDAPCDAFGVKNKDFSLREILSACEDFLNEKSQLQYVVESLGGSCQMSPKYHPEIAGEGIENLWGYIKKLYRTDWSIREAKDQKEDDFLRLIGGIMDGSDSRINSTVVRKAARRARDYMLAYSLIKKKLEEQDCEEEDQQNKEENDENWGAEKISVSYALIEKVVKQIRTKKTHRAPRDLDTAFINAL